MSSGKTSANWSRVEISSGRRRRWSDEEKGRTVAESFKRGARAFDVARRHDIFPQQLFQWRRQARQGLFVVPSDEEFSFANVEIAAPGQSLSVPQIGGQLEVKNGAASISVGPDTDVDLPARVLKLLYAVAR